MDRQADKAAATIRINGEPRRLDAADIGQLLNQLGYDNDARGIAVAVNGEVVPRADWSRRSLAPGDAVDIVGAVQGG